MVSHTEIDLVNANGQPGRSKSRSRKTGKEAGKKVTKAKAAETETAPAIRLKAIDLVDGEGPSTEPSVGASEASDEGSEAPQEMLHTEAPHSDVPLRTEDGETLVSDPELLELLHQLSETIDTANTVLGAATPDAEHASTVQGGEAAYAPEPSPEPAAMQSTDASEMMDHNLPPITAQSTLAQNSVTPNKSGKPFGFGLVMNAALCGMALAAGAAWLVHTNPWLLDRVAEERTVEQAVVSKASEQPSKDQAPLVAPDIQQAAKTEKARQRVRPATASLAPTSIRPAPMEPAQPEPTVRAKEFVQGSAGEAIALSVAILPTPSSPETSVMVQGVPESAKLSNGRSLGSGNWLLNHDQLKGLALNTDASMEPGEHEIEFILVKSDGSVPETRKVKVLVGAPATASAAMTAAPERVVPVAVAPETTLSKQQPASQTVVQEEVAQPVLSPSETAALLARGDSLLDEGDVAGARLLFEYAAQRGSADAMIKLAQSYDPEHLAKLTVLGVKPNAKISAQWYDRAAKANNTAR